GRPQLRSPTAPPTRNRSRHWYRDFGLIPSSAASTLGRSPASNRRSAASLNSRLNLRASFRAISSPFSKENCPSFHCLIPGVHSNTVEGWIPAFAGMTEVRNLRLLRHMRSPCPSGGEGEERRPSPAPRERVASASEPGEGRAAAPLLIERISNPGH